MLDFSHIPVPFDCKFSGHSQADVLRGKASSSASPYAAAEWQDEFRDYTVPGRMICDESYKYVCYLEPDSEELYDLSHDRLEQKNLARLPQYAPVLAKYRALLETHLAETNDDFKHLACSDITAYRKHPLGFCRHEGLSAVEIYGESIRK